MTMKQLIARFATITDRDVLSDERKYAIADMVDSGCEYDEAIELVDQAILATRE